ncbi:uncharacterized protein AC631_02600 [Debaryomyces fabryi]|uniref:UmuC domain-containing protein n=1 Tax=Debaryomyces fabryi TaxID=58627 RepID=A0A0V1PZW0_9ASCO|nr:uncharacterized protein AC631_02600 [Debaryomyces fabryi]KSA01660.1 hypothetical protein AC631_02600 [Debaryomyces fabryi]CUM45401.1 unnamed protein product [Debaryomyces fabryi]
MSVKRNEFENKPLKTFPNDVSNFTYKDLRLLENPILAYQLPLAVVAHVDLNAFFAQVEQIRLNLTSDDPIVCAQWQSLIAVSYAARKFGIGRMDTIQSAREKCPNIIIAHAAVFRKGDSYWSYVRGLPDQSIHKVLLDPYRRESRKIMKIFREYCDVVEKASVDECFLDFGRMVYYTLIQLFPELGREVDNINNILPSIPSSLPDSLYWVGEIIKSENEISSLNNDNYQQSPVHYPEIKDWDDVCILIGSQLLYEVRLQIYKELGYTTSGGLGRNKIIAKIAGGFLKPDNQTIIRTCLVNNFLKNFHLIDFNGMGGKTGDVIMQRLEIPPDVNSISFIRNNFSLEDMQKEFTNDLPLAQKIYEMVRGNHQQELSLRTDIKSMMSRKNFLSKKPVNNLLDAYDWIKVFAGDLYNRLIELDDESLNLLMLQQSHRGKGYIRRPKTLSIQITSTSYVKHSKQTQLPVVRSLDKLKENLEATGLKLLMDILDNSTNVHKLNNGINLRELDKKIDKDYSKIKIIPLANMSLVISNFVKNTDSSLIDSYTDNKSDISTQENIRKMFDEVNEEAKIKRLKLEDLNPKAEFHKNKSRVISKEEGEYVNKLFADFNSERSSISNMQIPSRITPEPIDLKTKNSQEDKEYIKSLFDKFENDKNAMNETLKPQSKLQPKQKEERKYNILQDLKAKSSSRSVKSNLSMTNDQKFFDDLVSNNYCSQCNLEVEDVFEHRDFHIALELSLMINGREITPETTNKSSNSPNPSERKSSNCNVGKGQSKLPF